MNARVDVYVDINTHVRLLDLLIMEFTNTLGTTRGTSVTSSFHLCRKVVRLQPV